jgi:hypothetical protein
MCSAINGIAIIIVFAAISYLIGIREFVWHMVVTVALLISVIYSANYFSSQKLATIIAAFCWSSGLFYRWAESDPHLELIIKHH